MTDWSPSLRVFDTDKFSRAVSGSLPTVVFIRAAWDPVCHLLETKLRQARNDYLGLHFYAMNLDDPENWPLAIKWGVKDTRTLVCLLDGNFHELVVIQSLDAPAKSKLSAWKTLAEE